jgi:hypothetical protein
MPRHLTACLLWVLGCQTGKVGGADSGDPTDLDGDGYLSVPHGGADCDDSDASVNPGATEAWYDGVDQDCDGNDGDQDGDGYDAVEVGGTDCDDLDRSVHPGATDAAYDGVDSDCSGGTDDDADGDGYAADSHGGDDCDDGDPRIHPGADEVWYDGVDQDCDEGSDFDQDGDGYEASHSGGEDCLDTDADSYPGAYDQPNDGVDQDCDGRDRIIDGAVVPAGEEVSYEVVFDLSGANGVELALLMDTTCSMSGAISALSATDIEADLVGIVDDLRIGYAIFDDYPYGSYGSIGSDLPFELLHGMSDDVAAVEGEIVRTGVHSGADGPESGMEALYQALTGDGYDMGCDASYDATYDVLPFLADAADPFCGAGGEAYDATVSGIGTLGGVGFTGKALPVVVLITDNYLRDPDAGYGTPGGCPLDAGQSDVEAAAAAMGAFLVGVAYDSTFPTTQLQDLARATGSLLDDDGDGIAESPAVYSVSGTSLSAAIVDAVTAIAEVRSLTSVYDEVLLQVDDDPYAMVGSWSPTSYTGVDTATTPSLSFTLSLTGTVSSTEALSDTITLSLWGDGRQIGSARLTVEVPPS